MPRRFPKLDARVHFATLGTTRTRDHDRDGMGGAERFPFNSVLVLRLCTAYPQATGNGSGSGGERAMAPRALMQQKRPPGAGWLVVRHYFGLSRNQLGR